MAQLCPICKKNKMTLGGMALKDTAFCSSCYDRINKKSSGTVPFDQLMQSDLLELVDRETDTFDFAQEAKALLAQREQASRKASPLLDTFRKNYEEFFATPGIEENASLQDSATQLLWHRLLLQKRRLNQKGITLASKIERHIVPDVYPVYAKEMFDGKFELALVRESIQGSNSFYQGEQLLHKLSDISAARYRILTAHQIGNNQIVCPACGNVSDRNNLLDGCDYCGTKFTIEDLGARISEYMLEKDMAIDANSVFYDESEYTASYYVGKITFILGIMATVYAFFTGEADLTQAILMIPGSAILAALVSLVFFLVFGIAGKAIIGAFRSNQGVDQINERYSKEQARHGDVLKKIKKHDPLFSAESFYSELENILAALHYASLPREISAFWYQPQNEQLQSLLDKYKNVINMRVEAAAITDYFLKAQLQNIKVNLTIQVLEEVNNKILQKQEKLQIALVKASNCKTEAVCAPSLLRCHNCGASVSLMEGCHCHYCGQDANLASLAWAIKEITYQK